MQRELNFRRKFRVVKKEVIMGWNVSYGNRKRGIMHMFKNDREYWEYIKINCVVY